MGKGNSELYNFCQITPLNAVTINWRRLTFKLLGMMKSFLSSASPMGQWNAPFQFTWFFFLFPISSFCLSNSFSQEHQPSSTAQVSSSSPSLFPYRNQNGCSAPYCLLGKKKTVTSQVWLLSRSMGMERAWCFSITVASWWEDLPILLMTQQRKESLLHSFLWNRSPRAFKSLVIPNHKTEPSS